MSATGQLRPLKDDAFAARVRVDEKGTRRSFALTAIGRGDENAAAARERCSAMAEIAKRVWSAGHASKVIELMERAARTRAGRPWEELLRAIDLLCSIAGVRPVNAIVTVSQFGKQWYTGELHKKHEDFIKAKKHAWRDEIMARIYVDPVIGHMNIADVELSDCEEVMSKLQSRHEAHEQQTAGERARKRKDANRPPLPKRKIEALSWRTRRHVGQYLTRLLKMAAHPCGLRQASPIPGGWLPRVREAKAKECLYPDEDRKLLACTSIPLVRRLAYGFLAREGMRAEEASSLIFQNVDLERGAIILDENKTDDPRSWSADPGVVRALKTWKELWRSAPKPKSAKSDRVFPIDFRHLAEQLRKDLKAAGVTRAQLFEQSKTRMHVRCHDLRATFCTNALANGKTETWVRDRTGHRSTEMVDAYRRKVRAWSEMKLGALDPLDLAIPELNVRTSSQIAQVDVCPTVVGGSPAGLNRAFVLPTSPISGDFGLATTFQSLRIVVGKRADPFGKPAFQDDRDEVRRRGLEPLHIAVLVPEANEDTHAGFCIDETQVRNRHDVSIDQSDGLDFSGRDKGPTKAFSKMTQADLTLKLARLAAKQRLLKQRLSGDERLIAEEVCEGLEELEGLCGPGAEVRSITDTRRRDR